MPTQSLLLFAHASALVVWIGSIAATGLVLGSAAGDAKTRGALARGVYLKLAVPGFVVAFLAGTAMLLGAPRHYLVEHHWMHGKLTVALAIIGLHHVLGAKARRAAEEGAEPASAAMLAWVTVALALLAVAAVTLGPLVM